MTAKGKNFQTPTKITDVIAKDWLLSQSNRLVDHPNRDESRADDANDVMEHVAPV